MIDLNQPLHTQHDLAVRISDLRPDADFEVRRMTDECTREPRCVRASSVCFNYLNRQAARVRHLKEEHQTQVPNSEDSRARVDELHALAVAYRDSANRAHHLAYPSNGPQPDDDDRDSAKDRAYAVIACVRAAVALERIAEEVERINHHCAEVL